MNLGVWGAQLISRLVCECDLGAFLGHKAVMEWDTPCPLHQPLKDPLFVSLGSGAGRICCLTARDQNKTGSGREQEAGHAAGQTRSVLSGAFSPALLSL